MFIKFFSDSNNELILKKIKKSSFTMSLLFVNALLMLELESENWKFTILYVLEPVIEEVSRYRIDVQSTVINNRRGIFERLRCSCPAKMVKAARAGVMEC